MSLVVFGIRPENPPLRQLPRPEFAQE